MQIKSINISDIKTLQELSRQTYYDTFAGDNTAENMQAYIEFSFNEQQLLSEINNPDSTFYFAMLDNKAIGYLKLNVGLAQTEVLDDNLIEIERIYVLKDFHGQKAGQFLLDKAIAIARERNAEFIWLGVWEKNLKAMRFYEKNGFIPFGSHIFQLGDDEQTDIMMKLEL
jgi:ribosomal protein S18 acetylase RimI-like enzyme